MKYRSAKIPLTQLLLSSLFLIASFLILLSGKKKQFTTFYQYQIAAAEQMKQCIDTLRTLPFDPEAIKLDPNRTNLIGIEYSEITTTLGDLAAKRTSTNPDFAALLVTWFEKLNLRENDVVAIGCSGSFPALTIAAICAAEVLRLNPVIIISVGASSYGANCPQWTYPDIENVLFQKGVIHFQSVAASVGGEGDIGEGLSEPGKKLIQEAIRRNNLQLINISDIHGNIHQRMKIYHKFGEPKVFVNIGGAQINVGDYDFISKLKPGLNQVKRPSRSEPISMIELFLSKGIPVIHLLNIKRIALLNGLPVDPVPLPEIGKSDLYFDGSISCLNLLLTLIFGMAAIAILFFLKIDIVFTVSN